MMCWTSLQVRLGLASRTRAMMPAAMGEEAEVPVWEEVQRPWRSVVMTFLSPCLLLPEL